MLKHLMINGLGNKTAVFRASDSRLHLFLGETPSLSAVFRLKRPNFCIQRRGKVLVLFKPFRVTMCGSI
jgi:hypothetical protein